MRVELSVAGLRLIADASPSEITKLLITAAWRRPEDKAPETEIRVIENPEGT